MAEAVVSVLIDQLGSIIWQELEQEVTLGFGVQKEVTNLTTTLTILKSILEDAEVKQVKNEAVKVWLQELKHIAYDADDVLDEWNTRFLISQVQVRSYIAFPCYCIKPLVERRDIARKIKIIRERLDVIARSKDQLNLIENQTHQDSSRLPRVTSSIIDISETCGRDLDVEIIVSKLLGEDSNREIHVPVISIVGMGGLGKTTLAQLVLKEENVTTNFELKMWVCVSEPFDIQRVAKEIIEQATGVKPDVIGWEALHQSLCKCVMEKQYLLVLDDVWSEDQKDWNPLKLSLDCGARGSRILVTTRNEGVAKMMRSTSIHRLGQLSEDDCWSLFQRIALWGRSLEELEKYEEIGKEIAKKCKGIPLAAKTLASLMRFKHTKQDWRNVLASNIWEVQGVETCILPALLLSYQALPSYLKQCLIYCAIFPKDKKIEKDELVKLWMAQGFLGSDEAKELETIGGEYFDDLVMHSFFQELKKDDDGTITICQMHDLVHDFVQFLGNTECCILENSVTRFSVLKIRHLSVLNVENPSFYKLKNIRTLITSSSKPSLSKVFRQFTCLRALDLNNSDLEELPSEMGKLLHLRYLDLSYTELRELPATVCKLYNLQSLNLNHCYNLSKLPEGIGELSNLRHIQIECTDALDFIPRGIRRLTGLRTLCKFIVGGASVGCRIGDLGSLDYLKGNLHIIGIRQVENVNEAKQAELLKKKNLRFLELDFECFCQVNEDVRTEDIEKMEAVLEGLQPHKNLEKLKINGYPGYKFPCWMSNELSNIVKLEVYKSKHCTVLPAFGKLRFLESLHIEELESVKCINAEFFGLSDDYEDGIRRNGGGESVLQQHPQQILFPRLKKLSFDKMRAWEDWIMPSFNKDKVEVMPHLCELVIHRCAKLKSLPALGKLQSLECLSLWYLDAVKHLTADLLGVSDGSARNEESTPVVLFPKLTNLKVQGMPEWEEWNDKVDTNFITSIMPRLRTLLLSGCEKLMGVPHYMFSHSLTELCISFCPQLTGVQPSLPPLLEYLQLLWDVGVLSRSLPINNNNNYPNLKSVAIFYSLHSSLPQGLNQLTSVEQLKIFRCKFPDFKPEELRNFHMLHKLEINKCPILVERCRENWSILSHIRKIIVDNKEITERS